MYKPVGSHSRRAVWVAAPEYAATSMHYPLLCILTYVVVISQIMLSTVEQHIGNLADRGRLSFTLAMRSITNAVIFTRYDMTMVSYVISEK